MPHHPPATRDAVTRAALQEAGAFWRRNENGAGVSPLGLRAILGAFLFALLAALPALIGIAPLPYHRGQIASRDVFSRVDFEWRDPAAEERRLEQIEEEFARVYRRDDTWMEQVYEPVAVMLEKIDGLETPEDAVKAAKAVQVDMEPGQAEILIGELGRRTGRFNTYLDVIYPMRRVLEELAQRGVMERERYQEELNRAIQIMDAYGSPEHQVVKSSGREGPVDISRVRAILGDRFSGELMEVSVEFRHALRQILMERMRRSLIYDKLSSDEKLDAHKRAALNQIRKVRKDSLLLARGEEIDNEILRQLRAEDRAYLGALGRWESVRRYAAKTILLFAISLAFLLAYALLLPTRITSGWRLPGMALLALVVTSCAYTIMAFGMSAVLVPVGFAAGLTALAVGAPTAALSVTALGLLLLVVLEGQASVVLSLIMGEWLFAVRVPYKRDRLGVVTDALACGIISAIVLLAWEAAAGARVETVAARNLSSLVFGWDTLPGRIFWVLSAWIGGGVMILLCLPLVERFCEAATDMRLQRLLNETHPCLRRLVVEAPGTFHHCAIVGTLAEAGAEAIGANPLLAKAGSYYHDIGKIIKPEYFTENEAGPSRHDNLNPAMSTLIIVSHVKDGVEMAEQMGLPRRIIDIIQEHHGTSLVRFFHYQAMKLAQKTGAEVDESAYRYPGPVPRSVEAALVMLADATEAACRSLENPTSAHVRRLVHTIFLDKLHDHQFDESGLTLRELAQVEDVFVRLLTSMYHTRVKYPGQGKEGGSRRR